MRMKGSGYHEKIESLLLSAIDNDESAPSLNELAESLGKNPELIRRRLRAENTSYCKIKEEVRKKIAIEKLENEEVTVINLAFSLGYDDASSFSNAFKKWTGVSPSHFRTNLSSMF